MSWRPEGWKNPFSIAGGADPADGQRYVDYEDGANAILEALKEKGAWMTPEQMKLLAPDRNYPYGHLVFIPEDKTAATTIINEEKRD